MSFFLYISVAIFLSTLYLVLKRPYGIGIGYSALIGASASLLLGITTLGDVLVVWGIVWNATFTLAALIVLSVIFDEAGFFEYLSIRMLKMARGDGRLLFVLIILLGSVVSAFFANDGTALVLTPIVYGLLKKINVGKKRMIAFIMALGFVADSTSIPLVVSNLVNIVTASYFSIPFLHYSKVMILPDLVSLLASLLFLWIIYRKYIGFGFDVNSVAPAEIRDRRIFLIAAPFMVILVIVYIITGFDGIPVAVVAVPAVAIVAMIAYLNGKIDVVAALKIAPWQIVLFSLGMYIIVFGMGREGITALITLLIMHLQNLPGPLPVLFSGFLFSGIAALMNNMPSVMIINLSLSNLQNAGGLAYANVIANDIGPKFTTIGSLATLMWLDVLRKKGMEPISPLYYSKIGLQVGIPVLALTLLSLWMLLPLVS